MRTVARNIDDSLGVHMKLQLAAESPSVIELPTAVSQPQSRPWIALIFRHILKTGLSPRCVRSNSKFGIKIRSKMSVPILNLLYFFTACLAHFKYETCAKEDNFCLQILTPL